MPVLAPHPHTLTPENLILGLLSQQPAHGYEVQHRLTSALGQVWHLPLNQVYNLLRRLEARGLVTGADEPAMGAPPRRRFEVTAAGQAQFEHWLQGVTPPNIRAIRVEFTSRLFFALARDGRLALRLVEEQAAVVQAQVAALQGQLDRLPGERVFDRLGLTLRVRTLAGVRAWLEDCRAAAQPAGEGDTKGEDERQRGD